MPLGFPDYTLRVNHVDSKKGQYSTEAEWLSKAQILTFGDTIALFWSLKSNLHEVIQPVGIILGMLIAYGLSAGLMLRGAIGYGDFFFNRGKFPTIIGPAVTDCAAWHERGNWIGIHATPNFTLHLKGLNHIFSKTNIFIEYPVPLSNNDSINLMAVSWPIFVSTGELLDMPHASITQQRSLRLKTIFSLLKNNTIPPGTEDKYFNTIKFYDECDNFLLREALQPICPSCKEAIKPEALKCKHCGEKLDGV